MFIGLPRGKADNPDDPVNPVYMIKNYAVIYSRSFHT